MDTSNSPAKTKLLKDGFSKDTVWSIAQSLKATSSSFEVERFIHYSLTNFDELTLMERIRQVAESLHKALPQDYPAALVIVEHAAGIPAASGGFGEGMAAFRHAPFLEFIAIAGIDQPALSLQALERMTCHFSAEFAIRPFLEKHLDITIEHVARWTSHQDWRVRRLASEGTRPLLPWGRQIAALKKNPVLCLSVIEALSNDPSEVVRRSVANHVNDVSRLDPSLALAWATHWIGQKDEKVMHTIRHGLRTLVKKGDRQALMLLGYHVQADIKLLSLEISHPVLVIGEELLIHAVVQSTSADPVIACVDYAVRYAAARNSERYKVFKGSTVHLEPGKMHALVFRRDFLPRTTRKLYAGSHAVEIIINGSVAGSAQFNLIT